MRWWWCAVLSMLMAASAAAAEPPAFEVQALGVLGGDVDTNLSCWLLGRPGEPATVMIDGGSIFPGLVKRLEATGALKPGAPSEAQVAAALTALKPVRTLLLTHAHLDHLGGFVQQSTLAVTLAFQGVPPMTIVALPETAKAVRTHVFESPLWADFTRIPPEHPALALAAVEPGGHYTAGPFDVQVLPVSHTVVSAAFLIRAGGPEGPAFLHLGDTGETEPLWPQVAPLLASGALRGVAIEVSFPAADEKLARATGHLTRSSLLRQLARLAPDRATGPLPAAEAMTDAEAQALARKLAPAFQRCPIVATHIKAAKYDGVVRELKALQAAGLNVEIPTQGESRLY